MKIIIPILVGSAIGYFTNWLAIKMLFRPLEEKRILGFKIPFTPGLIPKERKRIAKSIGEAVGMYLLTPEKISQVISSEETKLKMREFFYTKLNSLRRDDSSYLDIIKIIDDENHDVFLNSLKKKTSDLILSALRDESLKSELMNFIDNNIYKKYNGKVIVAISKELDNILEEMKESKELKQLFIDTISSEVNLLKHSDKTLKEVIPENLIEKTISSFDKNKEDITKQLRELFYKPEIQATIKLSLEEIVEQNVSKMITIFIDPSTISDKLFIAISRYIDSPQAEDVAGFILKESLGNIMDMNISSIIGYILSIIEEEDISSIYEKSLGYILKEENKEKLVQIFTENIKKREDSLKPYILQFLEDSIDNVVYSSNFEYIIKKFTDENIDKLLEVSVSDSLKKIDGESIERLIVFADKFFNNLLKKELFNIVNLFDVSKIVEDEINSFDVKYTEELILNISARELKAITRLGALLGAIMGLLTPILQMI